MTRGMLLGKFLPPHLGHEYLIEFARRLVDELTVQVCTVEREPIPGVLRYQWMRDHFGGVRVVHNNDENPQTPEEDPEHFWDIWRESLLHRMPKPPDFVFASEEYGHRLAAELGATFVPVDPLREMIPISATTLRSNLMRYWDYLLPEARPHFVKRIVIVGPESSGKSTLTKWLAARLQTSHVTEYGRTFQESIGRDLTLADMTLIARAHRASEDAAALHSNRVLIVDTEAIITTMWSRIFCDAVPDEVEAFTHEERYRLYLLTLPRDEWADDGWRVHPEFSKRMAFFDEVRAHLESRNRPYQILHGTWEERQEQALLAAQSLLQQE